MSANKQFSSVKFSSISGISANNAKDGKKVKILFHDNCNSDNNYEKLDNIYNILDNVIYPEIMKRIEGGILRSDFRLQNAQLIMFFDESKNKILLNDEVKMIADLDTKKKKKFKAGELIDFKDIERINGLYPSDDNNPDAAHVMMLKFNGKWFIAHDLIYNLGTSSEIFNKAKFYFEKSKKNTESNFVEFINNIYLALELLIKSLFLLRYIYKEFSLDQDIHKTIEQFRKYSDLGNIEKKYFDLFEMVIDIRNNKDQYNENAKFNEQILDNSNEFLVYVQSLITSYKSIRHPTGSLVYIK
ncbi:MAG: hypothetical protein ACPKPY_09830 [Nitrososphaeraceae archaeon]